MYWCTFRIQWHIKLQPRQLLHAQQCTVNNEFETDISDAIVYRDLGFFLHFIDIWNRKFDGNIYGTVDEFNVMTLISSFVTFTIIIQVNVTVLKENRSIFNHLCEF